MVSRFPEGKRHSLAAAPRRRECCGCFAARLWGVRCKRSSVTRKCTSCFNCSLAAGFLLQVFRAANCRYPASNHPDTGTDLHTRKMPTQQMHKLNSPSEILDRPVVSEQFSKQKARAYAWSLMLRYGREQSEIGIFEPWPHRAAHESVGSGCTRSLSVICGNNQLRRCAAGKRTENRNLNDTGIRRRCEELE